VWFDDLPSDVCGLPVVLPFDAESCDVTLALADDALCTELSSLDFALSWCLIEGFPVDDLPPWELFTELLFIAFSSLFSGFGLPLPLRSLLLALLSDFSVP